MGCTKAPAGRLADGGISAKAEIGKRGRGDRVLTDDELRAVYKAAEKIGYPFGKVVQLLCLTGQWLNDIAKLSWSEIDFDKKLISLPGERMKMGIAHEIRLAPMALEILHNLPRQRGDYVFSMSWGRKPYTGFSRGKKQLDELSGVTSYVSMTFAERLAQMVCNPQRQDRSG